METAWQARPVFSRLPVEGYQNNPVADALTSWVDMKLIESKEALEGFYRQLDPVTCATGSLDFLAFLVGLSDEFYDPEWTEAVKRNMIAAALPVLWPYRGTLKALTTALDIHGIAYDVWRPGVLTLPFGLPGEFGTGGPEFYIRLPLRYARSSLQWLEAVRSLDNFGLFGTRTGVVYKSFYVGFSRLGEPLFNVDPVDPVDLVEGGGQLYTDTLWLYLL